VRDSSFATVRLTETELRRLIARQRESSVAILRMLRDGMRIPELSAASLNRSNGRGHPLVAHTCTWLRDSSRVTQSLALSLAVPRARMSWRESLLCDPEPDARQTLHTRFRGTSPEPPGPFLRSQEFDLRCSRLSPRGSVKRTGI